MSLTTVPTALSAGAIIVVVAAVVGCVTYTGADGGGGDRLVVYTGGEALADAFPHRDKLNDLADAAVPTAAPVAARISVASWALAGPFPDRFGDAPIVAGDAASDLVLATVPADKTSESMRCAARELGRFVLDNKLRPEPRLERYLMLRCGSTATSAAYQSLSWHDLGDTVDDKILLAEAAKKMPAMVHALVDAGDVVGGALVRNRAKKTAAFYVAGVKPRVHLDPTPQLATGSFVVAGKLVHEAEMVVASITSGPLGAQECTRDVSLLLPAFRFTCSLGSESVAAIDVEAREKGRVLSTEAAALLVVVKVEDARVWNRLDHFTKVPASSDVTGRFLSILNEVRTRAGVDPVTLAHSESAVAQKLAPHYFGALDDGGAVLDQVALGLIAGWDVDNMLIHGAAFAALTGYSGNIDDVMADVFDRPSQRLALLGNKVAQVALGTAPMVDGGTGVLVASYQPLHASLDAKVLFEKLRSQREQRGLGPVLGTIPVDDVMTGAAARLQKGEDMKDVGKDVLNASYEKMQRGLGIFELDLYDIEHIAFPEQLFSAKTTYVALATATHKRAGSPWGSTMLLIVFCTDEARVASR